MIVVARPSLEDRTSALARIASRFHQGLRCRCRSNLSRWVLAARGRAPKHPFTWREPVGSVRPFLHESLCSLGTQGIGKLSDGNALKRQDGIVNARCPGVRDCEFGSGEELFGNALGIERPRAGSIVDRYMSIMSPAINANKADTARH